MSSKYTAHYGPTDPLNGVLGLQYELGGGRNKGGKEEGYFWKPIRRMTEETEGGKTRRL